MVNWFNRQYDRLVVIVLFIPYYPIAMIGEWYRISTGYGGKFSLRETTKEYCAEAWEILTRKGER